MAGESRVSEKFSSKEKAFDLLCSLLKPKCLEQSLACSRCSVHTS